MSEIGLENLHVFFDDCTCRTDCPRSRAATPDDIRAAVVPLLDLEAAAIRYYEGDEIRPKPPYWEDCTDAMKGWYRDESKAIVYAALGLGEDE